MKPRPMEPQNDGRAGARYLALVGARSRDLERTFLRGVTPDVADLVGWQFRGANTPAWARLVGIKKFIKGFDRAPDDPQRIFGYNCPAVQNRLSEPWLARRTDERPWRFGFYSVTAVDPTARDNAHLPALLLDYGRGGNHRLDPSRGLRDYLIQVSPHDHDLYLGRAYYALGPARLAVGWFVLERHRRAP